MKLHKIEFSGKLEKYSAFIAGLILVFAFILRIYSAHTMPFIVDNEVDKLNFIKNISFNVDHLNLPLGDIVLENPLLSTYILKLAVSFFGDSQLGARIVFVAFSIFGLLLIYKLVKKKLGTQAALLSLFFLSMSQYHIGSSRIAGELSLILFFVATSMYIYFQALDTHDSKYVYRLALIMGLGCLNYPIMVLFIITCLLFFILEKKYRLWFKQKELYGSGLIILVLFSPYLFWSYSSGFNKLAKEHFFDFGFSLRSLYLYFGEIFAWLTEKTEFLIWDDPMHMGGSFAVINGKWRLSIDASNELPFICWVLGLLIFISVFYCFKKNRGNELIKFCLVMFTFVFTATSIIAGSYTLFDDHWWAGMTILPGAILCANMFVEFYRKYPMLRFFIVGFMVYFVYHAVYFVSLPEHRYAVPKKDLYEYYLHRAELYLSENKKEVAIDRCEWVLARTKDGAIIKKANDILAQTE